MTRVSNMAKSCGKKDVEGKAGAAPQAGPACAIRPRAEVRGEKDAGILKPV